jgi:hypothetical protein
MVHSLGPKQAEWQSWGSVSPESEPNWPWTFFCFTPHSLEVWVGMEGVEKAASLVSP